MNAANIAGTWVPDEDMHPAVNIWQRRYWSRGDIEGRYSGTWPTQDGSKPKNLYWHFPSEPRA